MTQLRIDKLILTNVGGFYNMEIDFGPRLNIVCGPNGVGKTTILDATASAFVANHSSNNLRKRSGSSEGIVEYFFNFDRQKIQGKGHIRNFSPHEQLQPYGIPNSASNIIYVKSNRDFSYSQLPGVLRDPDKQDYQNQQEALSGISVGDIKQWFSNRYLMSPHGNTWPTHRHDNFELAKTFFSILDPEVHLKFVDSSTFDIILDTPSGTIPFEYMSAGFRASYGLIFGILKEIEFRKLNISAKYFDGLILIDELDLHLHPTWHAPMLAALVAASPCAQIIVTTHSPHMIQAAKHDTLIILPKAGGQPRKLEGVDPEFGLIGWTIEEILRDVMGMDDPRPPAFAKMMEDYENAVTRGDEKAADQARAGLFRALHPSSVVRQILAIDAI